MPALAPLQARSYVRAVSSALPRRYSDLMSMRVSIDKKDPGFARYAELVTDGYAIHVTVNGVEVPDVVTADESQGLVIAHRRSPEGRQVCANGVNIYDTIRGRVKVKVTKPNDDRVLH